MRASKSPQTLILLGILCSAAPATAQYSTLELPDDGIRGPLCEPTSTPLPGGCPMICPMLAVCRVVSNSPLQHVCVPGRAVFCVDRSIGGECPADLTLRQRLPGTSIDICLGDRVDLCGDLSMALACFTAPGPVDATVEYDYGDCDGDTIRNGIDDFPCEAGPDVSVISADGSCRPVRPCGDLMACASGERCFTVDEVDPHTYCFPGDGAVFFCCGGRDDAECPNGDPCVRLAFDEHGFCPDFPYCPDLPFDERVACISYDGAIPVEPDLGDCDGDLSANEDDETPCGEAEADAGPALDAGVDAGATGMDGGSASPADVIPTFNGGGGCVCRAAPGAEGGSIAWVLGLLGLALARRRR